VAIRRRPRARAFSDCEWMRANGWAARAVACSARSGRRPPRAARGPGAMARRVRTFCINSCFQSGAGFVWAGRCEHGFVTAARLGPPLARLCAPPFAGRLRAMLLRLQRCGSCPTLDRRTRRPLRAGAELMRRGRRLPPPSNDPQDHLRRWTALLARTVPTTAGDRPGAGCTRLRRTNSAGCDVLYGFAGGVARVLWIILERNRPGAPCANVAYVQVCRRFATGASGAVTCRGARGARWPRQR
jgi:hypothetical protein